MKTRFSAAIACAALTLAGTAAAKDVTWSTTASEVQHKVGKAFTWNCPPGGSASGTIYGTDLYTTDSPVCVAAVHAGKIDFDKGGPVTFQIRAGAPSYAASTKAGIASQAWGAYGSSFAFEIDLNAANEIAWTHNASAHASDTGKTYTFTCPANGALNTPVYGSDTYTTDSAICVAAVHAGKIKPDAGGKVTIKIQPGQPKYEATTRHGVQTNGWGAYDSSYVFE